MVKLSGQTGSAVRAAVLLLAFLPSLAGNVGVAEGAPAVKKTTASKVPSLHLSDAHQGREYAFRIRGVTGVDITDFKCEVSPALPDGLSLDCARLTITGTPTGAVGTTSGAIRIYDSSHDEVSVNYEIDVVNHPDEAWVGAAPVLKRRAVVEPAAPAPKPVRETVEPVGAGSQVAEVRPKAAVVQPALESERPVRAKPLPSASGGVESQQAGANSGGGTKIRNAVLTSAMLPAAALTAEPTPMAAAETGAYGGGGGGKTGVAKTDCGADSHPDSLPQSNKTIPATVTLTGGRPSFTLSPPFSVAIPTIASVVVEARDADDSSGTWRALNSTSALDGSTKKLTVTMIDPLQAGQTVYVEVTGDDPDTFGTTVAKASMCGQKVYTGLQVAPVSFATVLKEGLQVITGTATPSTGSSTVNIALVQANDYDDVERSQDLPGAIDQAVKDAQSATAAQSEALDGALKGLQALDAADRSQLEAALATAQSQLTTQNSAITGLENKIKPLTSTQKPALTEQQKKELAADVTSAVGLIASQQKTLADAKKKASSMASPDRAVVIDLLTKAAAATDLQSKSLSRALMLSQKSSQATGRNQQVDSCITVAGLADLTDQLVPLNPSGTAVGYTATSNTGNFTLSLATATYAGQRFRPVQIFPQHEDRTDAQNLLCKATTSTVKETLDWGRVHADFVGGLLISNDSAGPTADNTAPNGNFSQAHQFYALNVEKVWSLPGCYLRIPAHDRIDPTDSTKKTWIHDQCYDWNQGKPDDARKKQHLWPGVSTYFQARLTAIPVSNASTVKQDTGTATVAGTGSAATSKVEQTHALASDPTTATTATDQTTANLISSAQTAKVEVGIYFPFLISRWEYEHRPNALFVAPLAKVGIDTVTGPSTTVTIDANGTGTTTHSFEQIYNNWSYGARVGHMELGRSASKAPETYSYLDITFGPYSNLQSYICHGSDHATSLPTTSTCLQPPSNAFVVSNGVDSRKRLYRLDIEGLLKIPATPLYVGLNANLGQKTLGAMGLDRSYAAPDDLRFFFGTKFDIAQVLMKFVK